VIVPTRSRPDQLGDCLAALRGLDVRSPTEVIVVDDDPDRSATAPVAAADSSLAVRLLATGGAGPAAARNLGLRAATGDWIAFTDDDCEPQGGWLEGFERALAGTGLKAAAGVTSNGAPGAFSEASQLVIDAVHAFESDGGKPRFAASNNVAFDRRALVAVGGFDESFGEAAAEDRDLCARWVDSGRSFVRAPEARVVHLHHLSPTDYWRQQFGYGRGAWAFHSARRRRGGSSNRLQPEFYASLADQVRAGRPGLSPARLACLAAASQLANAAGYASAMLDSAQASQRSRGRPVSRRSSSTSGR